MNSFSAISNKEEKTLYIRNHIPFFSVEIKDDYLHFYFDGTYILTNKNNKILYNIHNQYKNVEYTVAFFEVQEKVELLKNAEVKIEFIYDTNELLLEFTDELY